MELVRAAALEVSLRLTFQAGPWHEIRAQLEAGELDLASFSTEAAAVTLLYGLVAFGQIQLRKIDGHRHVSELLAADLASAA